MYLDFEVFQGNQGEKCRSFLSILRFFKKVKGVPPWFFENYFLYDFEEIENLKNPWGTTLGNIEKMTTVLVPPDCILLFRKNIILYLHVPVRDSALKLFHVPVCATALRG